MTTTVKDIKEQSNTDLAILYVEKLRKKRLQWKKIEKTFGDLYTQVKQNYLNLNPDHQRDVVHDDKWKSEILHSQIYDGDIPDVYFHPVSGQNGSQHFDSLDGKQRSSAIYEYIDNQYKYKHDQPSFMFNKKFSELEEVFQSFLKDDCSITIKQSLRTLNDKEIQTFFQKRQTFKATTCGEHLNSCVTSPIYSIVKEYIKKPEVMKMLECAEFKIKKGRYNALEAIVYILRIYSNHNDDEIDCSTDKIRKWFRDKENKEMELAFELVHHMLHILQTTNFKNGNSKKAVYTSLAWYIMNNSWDSTNKTFNIREINNIKSILKDKVIELPSVAGVHSTKEQRDYLYKLIKNKN